MEPKVLEVGDGVYFVEASHTNFVVIADGSSVTLVDTGYPRDRGLIESSLGSIGRTLSDVEAVLLTHGHVDHIGSAEWLRREHGVPVRAHPDEHAHVRGERKEVISEVEIAKRIWRPAVLQFAANAVASGALRFEHVSEVQDVSTDSPVDVPGKPIPIHTPGHTRGHLAFRLPDRGVVLSGDALITVDVWNRADRGPQLIRPQFNHDHREAANSLQTLATLDADVVVPGHGRPYRGTPAQAVEEALARLK